MERQKLFALLTIALASAMILVFGEVVVRLFVPVFPPEKLLESSLEYSPSKIAGDVFPAEKQSKVHKNITMEINERGTRGEEFSAEKPEGTVRILVLGGSSAFDVHASEGQDWPHLTEKFLRDRGLRVEVINAGTPGQATWNSLGRFYAELWMYRPDIVVNYHGWNDMKYFRWLKPEKNLLRKDRQSRPIRLAGGDRTDNVFLYYRNGLDRLLGNSHFYVFLRTTTLLALFNPLGLEGEIPWAIKAPEKSKDKAFVDELSPFAVEQFALNNRLLVTAAKTAGAEPVIFQEAWLLTEENESSVATKIKNYYLGLSLSAMHRARQQTNLALAKIAASEKVPYLTSEGISGRSEYFADQVHTTAAGSRAIAERLAAFLEPLVKKKMLVPHTRL